MATSDLSRFQEYLKERKQFSCEKKRYVAYQDKTLAEVVDLFFQYRRIEQGCAETTLFVNRSKIRRLLSFLTKDEWDEVCFGSFINTLGGPKGLQDTLSRLKTFLLKETGFSQNYSGTLITLINPFFHHFLQLDVSVSAPTKTHSSFKRIRIRDIDRFLSFLNKKYAFKLSITDDEQKKQRIRRKWAVERFLVVTMKYTWARSIEIQNIRLGDMKKMVETGRLHLRSVKRQKNPKEYQDVVVPDEYIKEWQVYEWFRDSNDDSDDALAITRDGKQIDTRFIRYLMHKYDDELVLPKDFTCHNIRRSMHTLAQSVFQNTKIAQLQLGDVSSKIADRHYNIPDTSLIKTELHRLYHADHIPGETLMPDELTQKGVGGDMAYV